MASWSKLPQCHAAGGIHANHPIHALSHACHAEGCPTGAGEPLPSPRAPRGLPDVFRSNRHRGFVGHRSLCDVLRAAEHRHGTPWLVEEVTT
jgi:hypothetical protein